MPAPIVAASAALDSVASLAATIASIGDAAKRRRYEQALASLNYDQQVQLNKLLLEANDEQARQNILTKTLTSSADIRVDAITALTQEKENTSRQLKKIALIGGIFLLGIFGLILMKRKNG